MRSKRWDPASNDLKRLFFEGAPALLGQLDNLILRPRRWWRETLLPITYLAREPTARNPLDGLADRLRQTSGILHSRISRVDPLAGHRCQVRDIRDLLRSGPSDRAPTVNLVTCHVAVQLSLPSHRVSPAVAADGHEAAVHPRAHDRVTLPHAQ
jgi:hypothetical protein